MSSLVSVLLKEKPLRLSRRRRGVEADAVAGIHFCRDPSCYDFRLLDVSRIAEHPASAEEFGLWPHVHHIGRCDLP